MKSSMKTWLAAALLCGAAAAPAGAKELPPGPALPALALAADDGSAASLATLHPGSRWVLLVVDAGRPRTQAVLGRLAGRQDWGDAVQVVALGDDAALHALQLRHRQLGGVRWLRDVDGGVLRALRLPGLPAMLGIDEQGRIAWQHSGLPADQAALTAQLASWLAGGQP